MLAVVFVSNAAGGQAALLYSQLLSRFSLLYVLLIRE